MSVAEVQERPARKTRVLRPAAAFLAALLVAGLTVLWAVWGGNAVIGWVITAVAIMMTIWATATAVRRNSVFLAPVAIVVLALVNPMIVGGLGQHVRDTAGIITVERGHGLIFWQLYPGIYGWETPDNVQSVDTVTYMNSVNQQLRTIVETTMDELDWSWQVAEGRVGTERIPNGFGGVSQFERGDSMNWETESFDGSAEQRHELVRFAQAAADELELPELTDDNGAAESGDGVLQWSDENGVLTVQIEGSHVALSYTGGPFLIDSRAEFDLAMRTFEGVTPPEPIMVPEIP